MSDPKKCDKCDQPATVHLTEIVDGNKIEKHLCGQCAEDEGITIKANVPIGQLLENILQQATEHIAPTVSKGKEKSSPVAQAVCEVCGMSFADFNETGLLGCPNDYEAFGRLIERSVMNCQDSAKQHLGKIPSQADKTIERQATVLKLRAELRKSIQAENYEQAANLRDQIKSLEGQE